MLIVDDEPNVGYTLSMIFAKEGFAVKTAKSCADALSLMKRHTFDVVITDLHMEKPDIGLQVAAEAHVMDPRPVVIVLTGYASMTNSREAMKIRVDYYAFKPVVLADLLEAVRRLMGRRADGLAVGQ
jgi:DNA-binding NtrC family response regulator